MQRRPLPATLFRVIAKERECGYLGDFYRRGT